MMAVAHHDFLARGGSGVSQKDYLSRGGNKTLGGPVKLESVTALRSTPQWLTATSSMSSIPSVGISHRCVTLRQTLLNYSIS